MRALCGGALAIWAAACGPRPQPISATEPKHSFAASHVRSFTDTYAVTAIGDSGPYMWAGTPRGLLRWELAAGHFVVMTKADGLPSDRIAAVNVDSSGGVWVATAAGISRELRGAWTNYPPAPVGAFLSGLVAGAEGKSAWAGGPEGLAHLVGRRWERYFPDTGMTALVQAPGGIVWVGTSGKGILRIPPGGETVEQFGPAQGVEIEVVRGLTVTDRGLIAIGEHPKGPRAALFDGTRFHSYRVEHTQVLEWAARSGGATFVGAGEAVFQLVAGPPDKSPSGPIKVVALPETPVAPPKSVALAIDLPSTALDDASQPLPQGRAPTNGPPLRGPRFDTAEAGFRLPEGVLTVSASERGLLVGTRFLGALRVENGVPRALRTYDLIAGAERLTVACSKAPADECYLATGSTRAWRFDGQSFEVAPVDPERDARVLAVMNDPRGDVLAIHRGATDHQLRISRVDDGRWSPITMQTVQVPEGAPDLNFAGFAPDGHLWVGLRYTDKEHDIRDHGAAEIVLESGQVIYHRQLLTAEVKDSRRKRTTATEGVTLPNDVVAMYSKSPTEAWFATRSGAARMLDGQVRVFTENDGLESELMNDIGPGENGAVWVTTRRGTGVFDGTHWTFPRLGPFYLPATSLGHDGKGHVFLGTDKGLYCVGDCDPEPIDARHGLPDDAVVDLAVDWRGRVWVLTQKGITIVEP